MNEDEEIIDQYIIEQLRVQNECFDDGMLNAYKNISIGLINDEKLIAAYLQILIDSYSKQQVSFSKKASVLKKSLHKILMKFKLRIMVIRGEMHTDKDGNVNFDKDKFLNNAASINSVDLNSNMFCNIDKKTYYVNGNYGVLFYDLFLILNAYYMIDIIDDAILSLIEKKQLTREVYDILNDTINTYLKYLYAKSSIVFHEKVDDENLTKKILLTKK